MIFYLNSDWKPKKCFRCPFSLNRIKYALLLEPLLGAHKYIFEYTLLAFEWHSLLDSNRPKRFVIRAIIKRIYNDYCRLKSQYCTCILAFRCKVFFSTSPNTLPNLPTASDRQNDFNSISLKDTPQNKNFQFKIWLSILSNVLQLLCQILLILNIHLCAVCFYCFTIIWKSDILFSHFQL